MPSLHRHGTDQKGVGIFQQVFCNAKRADVYTSALLADAMKPLNVLSKFENHFAIRTVRFQVQLEADGYFLDLPYFFLHPAESDVFSKVRVCEAKRSNESPSGAFKRQNGLALYRCAQNVFLTNISELLRRKNK